MASKKFRISILMSRCNYPDSLARERYTILTSTSHFELTNGLSSLTRARENLVTALFQLNAARVHLARSTGNLHTLS
jgi:outer membrane protein